MKSLLLAILCTFCISSFSQLPYSKMLSYTETQFKDNKFKYDKGKNRYTLNKSNGLNNVTNILSAVNGATADIKPHEDDYRITVQYGEEGIAYLNFTFYKDQSFHDIQAWLVENNIDVIETNSGKKIIQKFTYEDYLVELYIETVSITSTTRKTSAFAKSKDESYNLYSYTIYTGIEPSSKWHDKQREKKAKNNAKGKKKDIVDLF